MTVGVLLAKIRRAWSSGTLAPRAFRAMVTAVRRPLEVLIGYWRLSAADRKLELERGFADHRAEPGHHRSDPEHIRRIIAAYARAKVDQHQAAPALQVRGLWREWLAVHYSGLRQALEGGDVERLSAIFENLFRDPCTTGAGGYDAVTRYRSWLGPAYIRYVWCAYRDVLRGRGLVPQQLAVPHVGNPAGVRVDGKVVSIETLRHAYHAAEIRELLHGRPAPVCVEIGAGLGGQACQALQQARGAIAQYVIFDLPEVAALSSYYLLSAFPGKRVRLYGEGPVAVGPGEDYELALFPHYAITALPDSSVDLFYNSCSLSEMDAAAARHYLAIIERSCRGHFLHDNHDVPLTFRETDGSTSGNLIGSQVVPDPRRFRRVYMKPRAHGLPEDRSFKHFEYLYARL